MVEVDPVIEVDPVVEEDPVEVGPVKVLKYDRPGSWESIKIQLENQSKISLRSKQKLAIYIDSKNTLKTVLGCSEAKINGFLCFGHFKVFSYTYNTTTTNLADFDLIIK